MTPPSETPPIDRAWRTLTVSGVSDSQRLDQWLCGATTTLSRRMAKRMCLDGRVRVNGERATASTSVRDGDTVRVPCAPTVETTPTDARALQVLHVSEDYVYVHKPARLHVHRRRPDEPLALSDLVISAHPECADASVDAREGGAVHRLDAGTAGVVAFARSRDAWQRAHAAFTRREVRKTYRARAQVPEAWSFPPALADLRGAFDRLADPSHAHVDPPSDAMLRAWVALEPPPAAAQDAPVGLALPAGAQALNLRAPLARTSDARRVQASVAGQSAHTRAWLLAREGAHVDLAFELVTGRRHQARVHAAALGAPLLGDRLYGRPFGRDGGTDDASSSQEDCWSGGASSSDGGSSSGDTAPSHGGGESTDTPAFALMAHSLRLPGEPVVSVPHDAWDALLREVAEPALPREVVEPALPREAAKPAR